MRVTSIKINKKIYTSNVFLVRGNFNALSDINTLIDTGADGSVANEILKIHTGVGKKKLDRVILTHSHFDHIGGLRAVKKKYNPKIYAHFKNPVIDYFIKNEEFIKIGDTNCQVFHVPDHSNDSICIICEKFKIAFIGDTPFMGIDNPKKYSEKYIYFINQLYKNDIRTIFPGHGNIINISKKILFQKFIQFF